MKQWDLIQLNFNVFLLLIKNILKDLKKGLIKVMDKLYEPLIHAFLTDMNSFDAERIYESLYVIKI